MSVAFAQLKVANNSGRDLKVTINGEVKTIAFKGVSTFAVRVREVNMDIIDLSNNQKFNLTKTVSGSGRVQIEPGDCATVQTQTTTVVSGQVYQPQTITQTTSVPAGVKTGSIGDLFGDVSASTGQASPQVAGQINTQTTQTITPTVNQPVQQQYIQQPQNTFNVWVINKTDEAFKVFSDIGGKEWQGLEFSSAKNADTINSSTRNRYYLPVMVGDMHMGVVYPPKGAIYPYGELRKRVNPGITKFTINTGEITKMSTEKEKMIRVRFMALGYELYFEPKDDVQGGSNDPISIKYKQTSRRFMAPIGQFYLKVSVTDPKKMFHPTVFIPLHVTSTDQLFDITTFEVVKALNADINLNWINL